MQRISARFAMVTSAAFSLNLLRGRRMHLGAFLLVLGNLVLASIYSAQLPILEGQDEHEHVAVVEYIVRTGTYPVVGPGAPIQAYHPPLYYALMAGLAKPAPRVDELHRNPAWGYDLYRPGNDNKNQFVHTNAEEFPYAGSALTVHVLRIATAMMAAGMAALTFATAQEIFPGAAFEALASAALVAFLPAWLASSSAVGNDALAGALHIYIAVRALTRNTSWRLVIALGIATGLLWLTKLSATIVVPIAWAAVALGRSDKHRRYGDIARRVGVLLAVALTLSGWWFVRSYTLYGDVTAVSAVDRLIGVTGWNWQGWRWYADVLLQLVQDFWLRFSLGTVVAPAAVYLVLAGLSMLSIVGGGRWLWRRAWKPAGP
ncbi:MAG: hypothetical protein ACE5FI_17905, partial [Anaerolineales bacterium]